ncbi:MAG: endonuclease III [candidate division Zixibacteria bacterium]|nr:endonuclease III [candidate division Zixibacteria bacterium]
MNKKKAAQLIRLLKREYPNARCTLDYRTPIQLVVATILSAQSTDERVNLITPALFHKYRSVCAFAATRRTELEQLIEPVGLYRNKAKNIIALTQRLVTDFHSRVPRTIKQLQSLAGIGRKSANVIKGELYGEPEGIAVDTHVARLSYRLGLTDQTEPRKVEQDLMNWIERSDWILISHLLIQHGRNTCKARLPQCDDCVLESLCPRNGVPANQRKSSSAKTSASKR